MRKYILNPFVMFILGLGLGVLLRIYDIYFDMLANIFSSDVDLDFNGDFDSYLF